MLLARATNGIDRPSTDFLLAQFAISCNGNTEKAANMVLAYNRICVGDYQYDTVRAMNSPALGFSGRLNPGLYQVCKEIPGRPLAIISVMTNYLPEYISFEKVSLATHVSGHTRHTHA